MPCFGTSIGFADRRAGGRLDEKELPHNLRQPDAAVGVDSEAKKERPFSQSAKMGEVECGRMIACSLSSITPVTPKKAAANASSAVGCWRPPH
jgi:hypothetical protein